MLPTITIDGRLVADPELRFTQSGKAVCSFRVAANDAKKLDDGSYENTEQIFIGVSLWEADAEAAAEALTKGDPVLITGRLYERPYETRDGEQRKSLEMKYPTVAKVIRGRRGGGANGGSQPPAKQAASDPWAVPSAPAGEPPF